MPYTDEPFLKIVGALDSQARAIPQYTEHQTMLPEPNRVSDRFDRTLDLGFAGNTRYRKDH